MLIFSAEPQNHVNMVLLAHLLSLLKSIKCDSIEFSSVQKGRENGYAVVCVYMYIHMYVHVKTVDARVVTCSEDRIYQGFTGREQGLVNSK